MTLKELAALAHVSLSTVFRAFSGSNEISKETRDHIFDVARSYGCFDKFYKEQYPQKIIAVICPEIQSEFYYRMVTYLEELLNKAGVNMVLSLSHFDPNIEKSLFSYHAYYQNVDGIIIIRSKAKLTNPDLLPAVLIDSESQKGFDSMRNDTQAGIDEAIAYLREMGHKRIAYIGDEFTLAKKNAFLKAMKKYALPITEDYIIIGSERFENGGYKFMEQLLSRDSIPTAVLAAYDYLAIGAVKCARNHGLSVPEDISFIGMDDIHFMSYFDLPITSIRTCSDEKCEKAVELILKKMKNKYFTETQEISFHSQLVKRNSVGKAPVKA